MAFMTNMTDSRSALSISNGHLTMWVHDFFVTHELFDRCSAAHLELVSILFKLLPRSVGCVLVIA